MLWAKVLVCQADGIGGHCWVVKSTNYTMLYSVQFCTVLKKIKLYRQQKIFYFNAQILQFWALKILCPLKISSFGDIEMFAVGSLNILDMDMCVADMVNYISFTYVLLSFVNCHNKILILLWHGIMNFEVYFCINLRITRNHKFQ